MCTSLHKMCIESDFSDNYKEIIENFKESFEVVHRLFGLSKTLKIHNIVDHYSDYFEMTGTKILKVQMGNTMKHCTILLKKWRETEDYT